MTRKNAFFEGWSSFKFNNLGLSIVTNLKFYTSLSKGLKLKVRKLWGLIPTFVEVTGDRGFAPPILNREKIYEVDTAKFLSSPGSAWQTALK